MVMQIRLGLLASAILLSGCPHPQEDPAIPPPNPPVDTDWCGAMCNHIGPVTAESPKALNCEEGQDVYNSDKPGPKDVPNQTCEHWCIEMQDRGFFINPRCVSIVPSCDKIEEYRQKEPSSCLSET